MMKSYSNGRTALALLLLSLPGCGGDAEGGASSEQAGSEPTNASMGSSAPAAQPMPAGPGAMPEEMSTDPSGGPSPAGNGEGDVAAPDITEMMEDDVSEPAPVEPADMVDVPASDEPSGAAEDPAMDPPGIDQESLPMVDEDGNVSNPDGCPATEPSGACDGAATACVYDQTSCVCLDGDWQCFDPNDFGAGGGGFDFGAGGGGFDFAAGGGGFDFGAGGGGFDFGAGGGGFDFGGEDP